MVFYTSRQKFEKKIAHCQILSNNAHIIYILIYTQKLAFFFKPSIKDSGEQICPMETDWYISV